METYNINAMRSALEQAYKNGNRSVIRAKDCKELGISEGYYKWYVGIIKQCYEATCAYVRVKNSPSASDAERKKAMNVIYPKWKALLECGEEDQFKRQLRCTDHDVSNLVAFVTRFIDSANNVNFDKGFIAQKVYSTNTLTQFQKKVETDIGIRMAQVAVLSDEERDRLENERKLINKVRKVLGVIEAKKEEIEIFSRKASSAKDDIRRAVYLEEVTEREAIVKDCEKTIEELKTELASIRYQKESETENGTAA